jgi:penicillin G amidase
MKFLKWTFIIIVIAVLGIISAAFLYLQSSRPVYHGEIHIPGISKQVKIYFDTYGIPHIQAANEKDAYFALGYIHAQERLFQMELLRRVGAGRLAEVLGEDLVPVDALFRTLGIAKSAKESVAMFFSKPDEEWQENTNAYVKGINAFMFTGPTPPEFLMLGIPKVKFTVEDIYLITGYMSFSFAEALRTDPILDKIQHQLGNDYMSALNWGSKNKSANDSSVVAPSDSLVSDNSKLSAYVNDVFKLLPIGPWLGSNGWAISPSKSASGKVLFANDTHIGYQQPAVWYEAHLEYPGFSLYGNYLAGMPFPLVGHTKDISWGLTMFENDDMNLYREKSDGKMPGKYNYKGIWENFQVREEIIKIKNRPDSIINVRESVHGPVVNDVITQLDKNEKEPIALWWTYTRFPATALQVTFDLAHSTGINDARKAASRVSAPGLNIIFGDKDGNIALWSAAKLPIYKAGMNTKIILNGSTGEDDIQGYYEFEENPQIENPAEGFVYSSNQEPAPISGLNYPGYYAPEDRSLRIHKLLSEKEKWNLNDLKKVSTDVISNTHPLNAQYILKVLNADSVLKLSKVHLAAVNCLRNWNGSHLITDTAPTIYYKLLANILEMAMKDELGEVDFNTLVNTHLIKNSYSSILMNDSTKWWDDVSTKEIKETRLIIFAAAFKKTIVDLQTSSGDMDNWTWGGFHTLEHVHPIGKKSPFDKIFNVGPLPAPGGIETINNAGFPLISKDKFQVAYGPAMRILIDMNDIDNAVSVLPTGESGHLRSPYYRDQNLIYINGTFRPMLMNSETIRTKCTNILTLKPQ